MKTALELIGQYGMPVSFILNVVFTGVVLYLSTKFAPKTVEGKIVKLEKRVDKIDVQLESYPTREDFHSLEKMILSLQGDLKGVDESFDGMEKLMRRTEKQLNMVDQYLRSQK